MDSPRDASADIVRQKYLLPVSELPVMWPPFFWGHISSGFIYELWNRRAISAE